MSLTDAFEQAYPKITGDLKEVFTPYRVCPIGAHVDHQYGLITGFALDRGVTMLYHPEDTPVVRLRSMNFDGEAVFAADGRSHAHGDWGDYARAASWALSKAGHQLEKGFTGVVMGTLPIGGLSSSAAVIITYIQAFCRENGIALSDRELIETALSAENGFIGLSVGKLDQSCEVLSKKDCLLFLDTLDDTYDRIPRAANLPDFEIAIFFSGLERSLVGSKFNARVDELKAAAYALMAESGMEYGRFADARLRLVPRETFEKYKDRLPENWRMRATHFYTEFDRVKRGVEAWKRGDLAGYGACVFESGHSSIYNYETGSPELKALYEAMRKTDGVYGGRFSGAGFKGCCMALIDPRYKDEIERKVTEAYLRQFPALKGKYSVHFCGTADGCGTSDGSGEGAGI
jgi:galactokinase/galacturonokinase